MPKAPTKDDFADIRTEGLVEKVGDAFAAAMREDFEEGQLVGMDYANAFVYDERVCASHDYCDANMTMLEAFADTVAKDGTVARERAEDFAGALVNSKASDAAKERATAIWGEAWARAKKTGFSLLRRTLPLEDFRGIAPSLMVRPSREDSYPGTPDNTLSDREGAPEAVLAALGRGELDAGRLGAMVEAIRQQDDEKLASLVDDVIGAEAPTP